MTLAAVRRLAVSARYLSRRVLNSHQITTCQDGDREQG
jgi:hypothetical protein